MMRKMKMNNIGEKINALEKERKTKIKKINSDYDKKFKLLTSDYKKDDCYGDYELQFDLKKNVVVSDVHGFVHRCKPCNKWSKKSDWFIVEIEDYDIFTTYIGCGYGEYPERAMFRVKRRYEVCPNCGRMIQISTKKFESGESKNRWEEPTGFNIKPIGWTPKIKIIGRKKNRK